MKWLKKSKQLRQKKWKGGKKGTSLLLLLWAAINESRELCFVKLFLERKQNENEKKDLKRFSFPLYSREKMWNWDIVDEQKEGNRAFWIYNNNSIYSDNNNSINNDNNNNSIYNDNKFSWSVMITSCLLFVIYLIVNYFDK